MKFACLLALATLISFSALAQTDNDPKQIQDSLYIQEVESISAKSPKVLHAEPLFVDLIRDLGARQGEKEWNLGLGLTDRMTRDEYTALVEYEWAPIDRLGLEVEVPMTLAYSSEGRPSSQQSKINSLKLAVQYTFFVSVERATSLALGYIHEFELTEFANYGKTSPYTGNVYNPFLVAAKRWGNNFHTLAYTGPVIEQHREHGPLTTSWELNSNLHYMIPGTRNFFGVEFNKRFEPGNFDMVIRPQMRLSVSDQVMLGIVTGVPISKANERLSTFARLIYEPKHGE